MKKVKQKDNMGVIVHKEDSKENELTRRIDAELNRKMSENSKDIGDKKDVDFAEDAEYMKDLKKTGKYGWVWVILVISVLLLLVAVGMSFSNK